MGRSGFLSAALIAVTTLVFATAAAGRAPASEWKHWWGEVSYRGDQVALTSRRPAAPSETFSALVTTRRTSKDVDFSFSTTAVEQLRLNTTPNPWEVGWAMFRFRDLENYYYFILKPNGYELGKKHGSDAQIFLVTGETKTLAIGTEHHVRITARGARIRIWVDGAQVIDFSDPNPLLSGSVGLYEEDATVLFRNVRYEDGPIASVRSFTAS